MIYQITVLAALCHVTFGMKGAVMTVHAADSEVCCKAKARLMRNNSIFKSIERKAEDFGASASSEDTAALMGQTVDNDFPDRLQKVLAQYEKELLENITLPTFSDGSSLSLSSDERGIRQVPFHSPKCSIKFSKCATPRQAFVKIRKDTRKRLTRTCTDMTENSWESFKLQAPKVDFSAGQVKVSDIEKVIRVSKIAGSMKVLDSQSLKTTAYVKEYQLLQEGISNKTLPRHNKQIVETVICKCGSRWLDLRTGLAEGHFVQYMDEDDVITHILCYQGEEHKRMQSAAETQRIEVLREKGIKEINDFWHKREKALREIPIEIHISKTLLNSRGHGYFPIQLNKAVRGQRLNCISCNYNFDLHDYYHRNHFVHGWNKDRQYVFQQGECLNEYRKSRSHEETMAALGVSEQNLFAKTNRQTLIEVGFTPYVGEFKFQIATCTQTEAIAHFKAIDERHNPVCRFGDFYNN